MTEKFKRKDLKRNDLAETVGRTVDYVASHRKGVTEAAIAAGAVVLVVAGFFLVRMYRETRAGRELSAGLAALDAPLATDPGAAAAPRSFPTGAARTEAARVHLKKAASYGGTDPGRAAAVILAAQAEKPAESAETFTRAARDGRPEISAAAEVDAARLLASQGKTTEAIERLKRAIEAPGASAPKDVLLYALAQVYEASGATSDARATYQRLVNDYPASPYRADARSRLGTGSS
jgi:tetratricopeptide (TPR) repeat protein